MLDTYFFIPGDKKKYLDKIQTLDVDYVVIDLEDAVSQNAKKDAIDLVANLIVDDNYFVRIPFFEDVYSQEQIRELILKFQGRIAIPKLSNHYQLNQIKELAPEIELNMIVLVENPNCLINLNKILTHHSNQIHGIGFGSHDFCSITGIKHISEHFENYIRQIVLYAKAYGVNYIDGVDLDLKDFTQLKKECLFAFEIGASGKFLIHPSQIQPLRSVSYLTQIELDEINAVYKEVKDISDNAIEVYKINGKVYEKPHINRIKTLKGRIEKYYN